MKFADDRPHSRALRTAVLLAHKLRQATLAREVRQRSGTGKAATEAPEPG
ncbi:hypothetical protein WBP06_01390 [Novosphingobium sp. BL-8H]